MALKNITLTGTEISVVGLDGSNAAIRNDGADTIYAAKQPGITPGADGVLSIPAGGSAVLYGISGAVYALGTGAATIISSDFNDNPFKGAAQGGSGADDVARAAISEHSGNTTIHVTADDKKNWNGKATLSDAAKVFSNPNLLINSDFRNPINQRGKTGVISDVGYFIDRWQLVSGTVEITENGIVLNGEMKQILENAVGANVTATASAGTASYDGSAKTFTLTAAGEAISWAKLEIGSVATPFVPPDPATELNKCQRYYQICDWNLRCTFVGSPSQGCLFTGNLPVGMRATASIILPNIDPSTSTLVYTGRVNDFISGWSKGSYSRVMPNSVVAFQINLVNTDSSVYSNNLVYNGYQHPIAFDAEIY